MNFEQPLSPGTILENRYRILSLLGQGGMSRVYLADATRLEMQVAVKENLQSGADARAQFEREARLLARLSHPKPSFPKWISVVVILGGMVLVIGVIGVGIFASAKSLPQIPNLAFSNSTFTQNPTNSPTLISPTPVVTPTLQADTKVEATFPTYLTAGPGYMYDRQDFVNSGDKLHVLGRDGQDGDWLQIVTPAGKQGWIRSLYVKSNLPLSSVPVVAHIPPTPTTHPTPTARPSGTPTPSVRFPYKDDFGDIASGWSSTTANTSARYYQDGEYHIVVKKENLVSWTSRSGDVSQGFDDVMIQVAAKRAEGAKGNYGIVFRERVDTDNKNDAYFFRVDPTTGMYILHKLIQSEWTTLIDWTKSSAIRTGSETNVLKVLVRGSQITLFVNGQQLGSVTDSTFSRGKIGMCASSYTGETNFHVAFDDFEAGAAQ